MSKVVCNRDCFNCIYDDCIEGQHIPKVKPPTKKRTSLASMTEEERAEYKRAYSKAWRDQNKDKVRQHQRTYYARHQDKVAAYAKHYRETHKEAFDTYHATYRAKHRDQINANRRKFYAEHGY